jgi:tetratricopeptide (TPR) repeat protein
VRGIDEKLWKDAVSALNKSLLINPDLVLPRASLGVAYLVHPEGRDVKKAKKWFTEAEEHLKKDPALKTNKQALAALLVNAGVADLAAGDVKEAGRKFLKAEDITINLPFNSTISSMENSVFYNRALVLARSAESEDKTKACKMLESYLMRTPQNSAWWAQAYTRYAKLGKDMGIKTMARTKFLRQPPPQQFRTVTSVAVGKQVITLAEPTEEAVSRLGKDSGDPQPLFPDAKIMRWRFADKGIDVLTKDKVLAIFLTNDKAPAVRLQQRGVGGDADELKVGMSESAAKAMLKDQFTDSARRGIADSKIAYHFYPEVGIAVRYEKSRVEEIAIAQLPRRVYGEK